MGSTSSSSPSALPVIRDSEIVVGYRRYDPLRDISSIMSLVGSELSEPYVIYTYRYFLTSWYVLYPLIITYSNQTAPNANLSGPPPPPPERQIGVVVSRQDIHKSKKNRGYIAMLSVDKGFRKRGIGKSTKLVTMSIDAMKANSAQEVVLETEVDNATALSFYERMGFMREKRLFRFYMNGKDAFRLVLPLESEDPSGTQQSSHLSHIDSSSVPPGPESPPTLALTDAVGPDDSEIRP
ncbi:acyl-CoA N-acyltransferase [Cantharellus anzutake]|uniref:acyl-CoA N-acyltransferase n=1 Tax=Cantharellus anzutake TaxID=1750568 RepID=UPI001908361B|nr:acyl-CoA N-acyltransferase [Cantharellus anzutake]KAF8326062.1 acyl-CoA N-acyltransferase [Cantharellus anzutake]